MSLPPIHRVVTGHDAQGKAVAFENGPLPTVRDFKEMPGMVFHEVWETEGTPPRVGNGPDPTLGPFMHNAPKHGTRIRFVDFPPDSEAFTNSAQMKKLFEEMDETKGFTTRDDSPHPMMHRTESFDYGILIEGELVLVLDDSEVVLRPGSVVVQRGTNHAWANRSGQRCRMLFVQIDGAYDPAIAALVAGR
jgi:mannose-6-phosphate isomerase-like protein (cupin superfamily)